jgi:membrane-associated phospholipid phosphatase
VLRHGSIQVNTFPSGHAAGSVATALAVAAVSPAAGVIFGVIAAGIVIGSVVGRYHYAADSLAGVLVAVAAWLVLG